jgi:hypothetical protein
VRVRPWSRYEALAAYAGFIALSAYFGAAGMIGGFLPVKASLASRLPLHSPVFAGVALACVVGVPVTAAAALALRRHLRSRDAATIAGILLVGWIIVEMAIVREISFLQVVYGGAGLGLILLGSREILHEFGAAVSALPLFITAPLLRHWHLRWGATADEVAAPMPGDDIVPASQFTATRAITIDAAPRAVWPWLLQVGYHRAGFYSYDLLDNLGRPSAEQILPEWQQLQAGDVAAPMANPPTPTTSFVITDIDAPSTIVWAKPDSTWAWTLTETSHGGTRLVTRLKQRYQRNPGLPLTILLAEFGDFPMMRKMLLGIKRRAERPQKQSVRLALARGGGAARDGP